MKTFTRRFLKILKRVALGIFLFIGLYALFAFVLSVIPVKCKDQIQGETVDIYILSNGVHTDVVMPIKHAEKNWSQQIKFEHTKSMDSNMNYLAFGWGDKGFYLETPQWSDLKFSVAFKAMFHLGSSAMHCTFYKNMKEGNDCKKIKLSIEAYKKLVDYVEKSFTDGTGGLQHIGHQSYGENDAFYEAHRIYSLFYTCNTWANNALKQAGQKACVWTPSDKGIFYHYR